ncbi:DNA mismatch repair protein [Mycena kentingensis (nom. inval.)]|nr:DNA mismatch repair protein [Mycena kentingensis (nom. inval.)]
MSQPKLSRFFTPSPTKRRPREPSPDSPSKRRRIESDAIRKARLEQWACPRDASLTDGSSSRASQPSASTSTLRERMTAKIRARNNAPASSPSKALREEDEESSEEEDEFSKLTKFFNKSSNSKGKGKATPAAEIGPGGKPLTPLEQQVVALKKQNPGTVLMVEVGYKYKFFGEDAKIAQKELGMVRIFKHNFDTASIPLHRRDVHIKKLLSHGYKVGIVAQVDTAALKQSSGLFERKVVHMVTAATNVEELGASDESNEYWSPRIACVVEKNETHIAIISVSPSDGEVIWDAFDDTIMRIELETRLAHLKPQELLIQRKGLSKYSEKMLKHFIAEPSSSGARTRTEYFDELFDSTEAFDYISTLYKPRSQPESSSLLAIIADLPASVVVALAYSIRHLSQFQIAAPLLEPRFFARFTSRTRMLLGADTLKNLEIFQNETDLSVKGSLLSILDNTQTRFGKRLLKNWIGAPLVDKDALQERIDAVEEIVSSSSETLFTLRQLLRKLPDLGRGLCRIQYKQCAPEELVLLLQSFYKIGAAFPAFETPAEVGFKSPILNSVIFALPALKAPMQALLNEINVPHAQKNRKEAMWRSEDKFPDLEEQRMVLGVIEQEINDELPKIRKLLKMPSLKYTTTQTDEYLVEIKKTDKAKIPDDWPAVRSKTKFYERYHSPKVAEKIVEKARSEELIQIEAKKAFLAFLEEVGQHYGVMRQSVQRLATIDCLLSLAHVGLNNPSYVKPVFVAENNVLEIVDGRHPMIEVLRTDPYVPNSISFDGTQRAKCVLGPNMGGKSSAVRMVALCVIMAQIGSYCPAASVRLGLVDAVFTRMGAYDEIARGRSTFMVEMTETSEILHNATDRSLVILDELGRGTSTFDGMAIAHAVLQHIVKATHSRTLFITHYPLVATELAKKMPENVENLHVGYRAETRANGRRDVAFLYRLEKGLAPESFGVECARLAGLPEEILEKAANHSGALERLVAQRTKHNLAFRRIDLLKNLLQNPTNVAKTLSTIRHLS